MTPLILPLLLSLSPLALDGAAATLPVDQAQSLTQLGQILVRSTGAIEADVTAFRALLGNPVNGALPGHLLVGHREINWDGVPAALTNVIHFPNNFFNVNSPRGLVYDQVNRGLEVSDNRFANLNPTYAAEFSPFSGTKLFSPLGNSLSQ